MLTDTRGDFYLRFSHAFIYILHRHLAKGYAILTRILVILYEVAYKKLK